MERQMAITQKRNMNAYDKKLARNHENVLEVNYTSNVLNMAHSRMIPPRKLAGNGIKTYTAYAQTV